MCWEYCIRRVFALAMMSYGFEMKSVSVATAEHYVWGEVCDGWHLVRSAELSVIEERMPPGAAEQRHKHGKSRQFFYVVVGELTMELEGAVHTLGIGVGLEIAPGLAQQAMNRSGENVRFMVVSQPPSYGDRIASL
jgi:mannose-6-phosphate isomerase-like protein (cupin superfamily)